MNRSFTPGRKKNCQLKSDDLLEAKVWGNAKLKRRFGQTAGHDQIQVNEASGSYKMQHSKMADLSVVTY